MNWGRHPAIAFDERLQVGQVVEARFTSQDRAIRFAGRILALNERTARVESLRDGVNGQPKGHVFMIQRWASPLYSPNNGLFPAREEIKR